MSNFLNKFTDQNYAETIQEKDVPKAPETKAKKTPKIEPVEVVETPIEKVVETPKVQPTSSRRMEYVEETTKDPGYKRQRTVKIFIGVVSAIVVLVLAISGFYLLNQVRIPDYINQPISELKTWATRNNITLDIEETFSLEVSQDYVISVEPAQSSKIQKGSIVKVVVSAGSDPEEVLPIPDFTGVSSSEVQAWIDSNQAYNLRTSYEYSTTVPANTFIRIKFSDAATTADSYQRKDYAIVYISNGPEVFEKNIKVPDWTTAHKSVAEVSSWASTNSIQLTIEKEFSTLAVDAVIRQSVSADTLVAKNDKLTVVISKGMSVLVPDFSKLNMNDAESKVSELNSLSNVSVKFFKMYNDTNAYGTYIWQDVNPGVKIDQTNLNGFSMNVYYSLGKPYINSKVDVSESELTSYFYNLNLNAANLTYKVTYKNCTAKTASEKGEVCWMSRFNEYVPVGTNIEFIVHDPAASATY